MPKFTKKLSSKVGLPPGTLLHVGDTRADKAYIHVINYDGEEFSEVADASLSELGKLAATPQVTWIQVQGLNVKAIEEIGRQFAIHPLVLEDILHTSQRPKLADYGDYVCVIIKALTVTAAATDDYQAEQVSLILGPNYVISFVESLPGDNNVLANVHDRVNGRGRICQLGADYLFYALLDSIVDQYFLVLEHLGEKIETLEERIASQPQPELLHDLHALKHDMLHLRKSVWPVREIISALERGEMPHIKESTLVYLRDIYDHVVQVIETTEIYRDMLSGMLDIYLSSISNRMSEVMKMLTIISTIFIPLTFIAGVYGMNFAYMPELQWEYGYPMIVSIMLLISLLMVRYFHKKQWL